MAGHGAPTLTPTQDGAQSLAIVASRWHEEVMAGLVAGARRAAAETGIEPELIWVPGSVELPLIARAAAQRFDAVVALGVVIRGGTPHFDYVCQAATDGILRASLETGTPIGFGLLTCDDDHQARDRAGLEDSREDKGYEAAVAALDSAATLRNLC